ncbi:MAG: hypothetical protein ACRDYA_13905 [Egibacteraceae bacterium]
MRAHPVTVLLCSVQPDDTLADSRTTREIYTHTTKRMVDAAISAAADALDEVLEAASGS